MANPKAPGVYIQEIPKLPASIAEVETAIPGFIGYVDNLGGTSQPLKNIPKRITSLLEFEEAFGGAPKDKFNIIVTDVTANNTVISRSFSVSRIAPAADKDYMLYYSLQMFFANGGGPCWIVPVGEYGDLIDKDNFTDGIAALEKIDEVTLLLFPDAVELGSSDYATVFQAATAHCAKLQDRFTIADFPQDSTPSFDTLEVDSYRSSLGMSNLKYAAVYTPYINSTFSFGIDETTTITDHIGYTTANPDLQGKTLASLQSSDPSVYRSIIAEISKLTVTLPPSGAIAGIYARVDAERGVWKAPANVSISAAIGPAYLITQEQQEYLNVDPTAGKSINAIRSFTGKGTLVWGSRTLAGNDNEWRYVPVRRFFNFAEESIKKATEFVVFEPNDANTWLRMKTMIENFLTTQWRAGALAGAKPEDAFFVNVGLGTTMTALDILEGRLNVEIGMAVVRPAEFIILKFSHKLQVS
jgi:uncharacterized protein